MPRTRAFIYTYINDGLYNDGTHQMCWISQSGFIFEYGLRKRVLAHSTRFIKCACVGRGGGVCRLSRRYVEPN